MKTKRFAVPNRLWYEDRELQLEFPQHWDVIPCLMHGHDAPALTPEEITSSLSAPIGTGRMKELARGKKHVAIIFDDISRPTPVADLLFYVFEELKEAGIPDAAIRFICATGCHGAHTYLDFEKKLGKEILNRFPVYNHNVFENCVYVGDTSQGTKLYVNSEVMGCDLKIGIGSMITHPQTGFGGGGKIVLPGIAGIDSIESYHKLEFIARDSGRNDTIGMGNYINNPMVKDFTEAAGLAGLDFKIDVIMNGRGRACHIFCGDPQLEYYEAAKYAVLHYATRPVKETDIAVVNSYCKGNEAYIGLIIGILMLVEKGGDLVLFMDCPAGQVVHYLLGSFGKKTKGRHCQVINHSLPWLKKLIIICPQFEHATTDWLAIPNTIWVNDWQGALEILMQDYPGHARAAIVPDGTTQYLASA